MSEYRIDVISDAGRERVTVAQEYFEVRGDDRAFARAHRIVTRHVTCPAGAESVYGDLWRRAPGGSLQADYVDTVLPGDGWG